MGNSEDESLSSSHQRIHCHAGAAADACRCPLLPSSCGIDRHGSLRFQHARGLHAYSLGIARDVQPEFPNVSSQPLKDALKRATCWVRPMQRYRLFGDTPVGAFDDVRNRMAFRISRDDRLGSGPLRRGFTLG
jgi:hypothetical protein